MNGSTMTYKQIQTIQSRIGQYTKAIKVAQAWVKTLLRLKLVAVKWMMKLSAV